MSAETPRPWLDRAREPGLGPGTGGKAPWAEASGRPVSRTGPTQQGPPGLEQSSQSPSAGLRGRAVFPRVCRQARRLLRERVRPPETNAAPRGGPWPPRRPQPRKPRIRRQPLQSPLLRTLAVREVTRRLWPPDCAPRSVAAGRPQRGVPGASFLFRAEYYSVVWLDRRSCGAAGSTGNTSQWGVPLRFSRTESGSGTPASVLTVTIPSGTMSHPCQRVRLWGPPYPFLCARKPGQGGEGPGSHGWEVGPWV